MTAPLRVCSAFVELLGQAEVGDLGHAQGRPGKCGDFLQFNKLLFKSSLSLVTW